MKQEFTQVSIRLTMEDFELSREGFKVGEMIKGSREVLNGKPKNSVWFGSKNYAGDCVATIGVNCELVR